MQPSTALTHHAFLYFFSVAKCFNTLDPDAVDGPGSARVTASRRPPGDWIDPQLGSMKACLLPVSSLCGAPAMLDA